METIHLNVLENSNQIPLGSEQIRVVEAVSPSVALEHVSEGVTITVRDLHGEHSETVYDGSKGEKGDTGEAGYTPVRGVDYWTETDKEEIVAEATPERGVDYWTAADQQAIAAEAQSAAEVAAEATATEILNDPEYKASIKGGTGEPGYTPVKGVDYFDGQDGQPGRDGQDGASGQDGVSPTITVTDITGGHRVTITDADGAHSFDVMDGEDGGGAVQDVRVNGTSVLQDGVANVPLAASGIPGVIMVGTGLAIGSTGILRPNGGTANDRRAGTSFYVPTVMATQHESTFYGLAKAAGDSTQSASSNTVGTYTESAKSAISEMLSGSVSVSGTTPTINVLPGIRYVCGEVTTLDIALPDSGIVDVVFESGSTPTVLTVTPPTGMTMKWANGFDPASLDANTIYEVNVMDGYLGVCGKWS